MNKSSEHPAPSSEQEVDLCTIRQILESFSPAETIEFISFMAELEDQVEEAGLTEASFNRAGHSKPFNANEWLAEMRLFERSNPSD